MYCKIIEEVCREPLGEIQFEKNARKTKWKGGKDLIEPLGGVEIIQGSVESLLRVLIRYWRGLFQDP
jgi:hypothetical protein